MPRIMRLLVLLLMICFAALPLSFTFAAEGTPTVSHYTEALLPRVSSELPLSYAAWQRTQAEGADAGKAAYGTYLSDFGRITYGGDWSNGVIDPQTGRYEPITRVLFFADRNLQTADSWDGDFGVCESYWQRALSDFLSGESVSPWQNGAGASYLGTLGCAQPSTANTLYAYAYRAPTDGFATLSFDLVAEPTSDLYLAVLVDGYMVFPTEGGRLTDKSDFYKLPAYTKQAAAQLTEALSALSVYLPRTSQLALVLQKDTWAGSTGEGGSAMGFVLHPTVALTKAADPPAVIRYEDENGRCIARYAEKKGNALPRPSALALWDTNGDKIADTLPTTVTGDLTVKALRYFGRDSFAGLVPGGEAERGNWSAVQGCFADGTLTRTAELCFQQGELYTATETERVIGMTAAHCFSLGEAPTALAAVFVAPTSGYVDISFDRLIASRTVNRGDGREHTAAPISCGLAILQNGRVIWPQDTDCFLYESRATYTGAGVQSLDLLTAGEKISTAAPPFPKNLYLAEGDELSFVFFAANGIPTSLLAEPSVTYTHLAAAPTLRTLYASLGTALTLHLSVDPGDFSGRLGAFVDGSFSEADESGYLTLGRVYAKDLTEPHTITPAVRLSDGSCICGHPIKTDMAELLFRAYVSATPASEREAAARRVAIATLNYAAAAQTYFGCRTDRLANAALAETEREIPTALFSDKMKLTKRENTPVCFQTATLLLQDCVGLKLTVRGCPADITGYTATLCPENGMPITVSLTHCEKGSDCKAVFPLPPTLLTDRVEITVFNERKEPVSDTLTYGVFSYFARMADRERLLPLGHALATYAAACEEWAKIDQKASEKA